MNINWLSYWLGFGAVPALFALVFAGTVFAIGIVFAIQGRFDDSDEEEAEDQVRKSVIGNYHPGNPSQGADVHVPLHCYFSDDEISDFIGKFNSAIDALLVQFSEALDLNYMHLDKLKPGKHDKKIAKVEDCIFDTRIGIAILSFLQTHGVEAFLKYIAAEGFFDEDKLRARSVCDPFAPMPEDYPPLEEDKL